MSAQKADYSMAQMKSRRILTNTNREENMKYVSYFISSLAACINTIGNQMPLSAEMK